MKVNMGPVQVWEPDQNTMMKKARSEGAERRT